MIETTANLSANGPEIVSWVGTKKSDINGFVAFVTEYRRKSAVGAGIFRVRLVRFLAAERSFTLTISYLESESASLESVSDQIINSISLSKFDMLSVTNKEQGDISSIQELLSLFYGDRWLVRIILSFIITWSIGLVPPLLIRYLIYGKPIKSIGLAIGVVTILYVANVVIFTLLKSQSKSHGALLIIAFVSFWILRRGNRQIQMDSKDASSDSPTFTGADIITQRSLSTSPIIGREMLIQCPVCSHKNPTTTEVCIRCSHILDEPAPEGYWIPTRKRIILRAILYIFLVVLLVSLVVFDIAILLNDECVTLLGELLASGGRDSNVAKILIVFFIINIACAIIAGLLVMAIRKCSENPSKKKGYFEVPRQFS